MKTVCAHCSKELISTRSTLVVAYRGNLYCNKTCLLQDIKELSEYVTKQEVGILKEVD